MGTRRSKHNRGRKPLYKEHRSISDPADKRAFLLSGFVPNIRTAIAPTHDTMVTAPSTCEQKPKVKRHRLTLEERTEIVRLRVEDRLGSPAIAARMNTNTTTVCGLLKSYPLTPEEHRKWRANSAAVMRAALKARGNYGDGSEWTAQERTILERLWPTAPRIKLEKALPTRTWASIGRQANTWGIVRSRSASNKSRPIDPICAALREIREVQNITRDELGERIGFHRINIAKWELGQNFPKQHALRAWLGGLECDLRVVRNGEP